MGICTSELPNVEPQTTEDELYFTCPRQCLLDKWKVEFLKPLMRNQPKRFVPVFFVPSLKSTRRMTLLVLPSDAQTTYEEDIRSLATCSERIIVFVTNNEPPEGQLCTDELCIRYSSLLEEYPHMLLMSCAEYPTASQREMVLEELIAFFKKPA